MFLTFMVIPGWPGVEGFLARTTVVFHPRVAIMVFSCFPVQHSQSTLITFGLFSTMFVDMVLSHLFEVIKLPRAKVALAQVSLSLMSFPTFHVHTCHITDSAVVSLMFGLLYRFSDKLTRLRFFLI